MTALEDTVCPALLADIDRHLCMMLTALERTRGQGALFNLFITLKLNAGGDAEIRWKGKRKMFKATLPVPAMDGDDDD